jgi:hypothetical protein
LALRHQQVEAMMGLLRIVASFFDFGERFPPFMMIPQHLVDQ